MPARVGEAATGRLGSTQFCALVCRRDVHLATKIIPHVGDVGLDVARWCLVRLARTHPFRDFDFKLEYAHRGFLRLLQFQFGTTNRVSYLGTAPDPPTRVSIAEGFCHPTV